MHLLHYRAFSAGVQRTVGDRLSVAARIERLQGFHHLAIEENRWGLVTDATDWSWTVQGGGRIVSSGLNAIYQAQAAGQLDSLAQALPQRLTSTANTGWGAQAGIEMDWSPRLSTWIQSNTAEAFVDERRSRLQVEAFEWELDGFDATNGGDADDGTAALTDSVERWANQELAPSKRITRLPNRMLHTCPSSPIAWWPVRNKHWRGDNGGHLSLGGS